jgi:hypothetical protein
MNQQQSRLLAALIAAAAAVAYTHLVVVPVSAVAEQQHGAVVSVRPG